MMTIIPDQIHSHEGIDSAGSSLMAQHTTNWDYTWDCKILNSNLPDKRDYLILYTRFIFLVTVKAGCENVFFVPDPLGDHWYVSEHDYE